MAENITKEVSGLNILQHKHWPNKAKLISNSLKRGSAPVMKMLVGGYSPPPCPYAYGICLLELKYIFDLRSAETLYSTLITTIPPVFRLTQ